MARYRVRLEWLRTALLLLSGLGREESERGILFWVFWVFWCLPCMAVLAKGLAED